MPHTAENLVWGSLVNENLSKDLFTATFNGNNGKKYILNISLIPNTMWVFEDPEGPLLYEIDDADEYTQDGVVNRGFELKKTDNECYVLSFSTPERVNISMLIGMAEMDPESILTVEQGE